MHEFAPMCASTMSKDAASITIGQEGTWCNMTPGSDRYRRELLEIAKRFADAVGHSFDYLSHLGFVECPPMLTDLDDLRDAMTTHRYTCGKRAINVALSLVTRQISIAVFEHDAYATCDVRQRFVRATELESWIKQNDVGASPKLDWMRKQTLTEEMQTSYNAFIENMDTYMEEAVAWQALRLRNSGLLAH